MIPWKIQVAYLSSEAKRQRISQTAIAQEMGVERQQVQATLKLKHEPKLGTFLKMCEVLNIKELKL
jgi:transcriptional regulator with XRE-family HTH domain